MWLEPKCRLALGFAGSHLARHLSVIDLTVSRLGFKPQARAKLRPNGCARDRSVLLACLQCLKVFLSIASMPKI